MTEHPILFAGRLVRAILEGRKTQTRRIIRLPTAPNHLGTWEPTTVGGPGVTDADGRPTKDHPAIWHTRTGKTIACPYGEPGHRLWVRETWASPTKRAGEVFYAADEKDVGLRWKPSIHMPRWASRITLEVTGIRVERLQAITEDDAKAEGVEPWISGHGPITEAELAADPGYREPSMYRHGFEMGWDSINAKRGPWASNPWVWVVEFKRAA